MPKERFFYSQEPVDSKILLDDKEFHHLFHVMRAKVGQSIEVVNGKGALYSCVIEAFEKKAAKLHIESTTHAPEPAVALTLAQAIPRSNKLDLIIEKGTELGCTTFLLFPAEKGEKKELKDSLKKRLEAIAISAMKQSGRLYLPEIIFAPPIKKWQTEDAALFFGSIDPDAPPILSCLQKEDKNILFAVGPESGWSDGEVEHLQSIGYQEIKINNHVLRTETAAVSALAILGAFYL